MTRTLAHGPGTIQTYHNWQNLIALCPMKRPTPDEWKFGHLRIEGVQGLKSLPDAPEAASPHRGRRGTQPYSVQPKSKSVTYTGVARGKTLDAVEHISSLAVAAFRDRNTEGTMAIQPVGTGPAWFYFARPAMFEVTTAQKNGPDHVNRWERDWTLQLTLYNPRIYALQLGFKSASQGSATLYNEGLTDTDPVFELPLFAGGDLELQNAANNRVLRFEGLPAGALKVDFYARTLVQDNQDRTGYMDPDSDWWDESVQGLLPGNNLVRVYGDGGATPTWSCSWYPAVEG